MNSGFEPGILSPLSQYLQEGSNHPGSLSTTPRPGTPRAGHFRHSPDGIQNPGTPGALSTAHDHHKFPNSPWSGSEPATPGSGYSRNVVPNSPYLPSYPNTPATPGGGFYQKPAGIAPANNGSAPGTIPGSPWTDRSVCTPGPMTPLTPTTPMHSVSDHGGSNGSCGFGNVSPTLSTDSNGSKSISSCGSASKVPNPVPVPILQEIQFDTIIQQTQEPTILQPQPLQPPQLQQVPMQQSSIGKNISNSPLPPQLPPISDNDIYQVVENNPNLISEFEEFFNDFMRRKNEEENGKPGADQRQFPVLQQPQTPAQPQPPQYALPQQRTINNGELDMCNIERTMYNMSNPPNTNNQNHPIENNGGIMPIRSNNGAFHHMPGAQPVSSSIGPIRTQSKFGHDQNGHHPYMLANENGGAMRNRQLPGHFQQQQRGIQYANQPHDLPPNHPHANPMGSRNLQNRQQPFGLIGQTGNTNPPSVYAPPPTGNNGGYVQVLPPNQHPHHNPATGNVPPIYPQSSWQEQSQQPQQTNLRNNHNSIMGIGGNSHQMPNPSRGIPHQSNPAYFQNPVNSVSGGGLNQHNNHLNQVMLPPTPYNTFDLNGGGGNGGSSTNVTNANNGLGVSHGNTGGMQMTASSPMPLQSAPGTPNPVIPLPDEPLNIDLDRPYDGSSLSQATWTKALDKANRSNAVAEVGKVLFDDIFSDDEVIHCTLSGRGSTKKFNPNKVLFLKKAVAWLMTRPQRPWEFNVTTCELSLSQEDESGVRGVEKKVFTEYRSRRRGDILKTRPGLAPPPTPC